MASSKYNNDIKEEKASDLEKLCIFLGNYQDDFQKYDRIMDVYYDEGQNRFNFYELYVKIKDGNTFYLINEFNKLLSN